MKYLYILIIIFISTNFIISEELYTIIEGRGINNLYLNDNNKKTVSILGNPDFIWVNEYPGDKEKFWDKYAHESEKAQAGITEFIDSLRFYKENNNFVVFNQPFFSYCYLYYDKGIVIFFDKENKIVQFIFITDTFIIHMFDVSYYDEIECPLKPIKGKLHILNVSLDNTFEEIKTKINYKKIKKYDIGFTNFTPEDNISNGIIFKLLNTELIYSPKDGKLNYICIYSKKIGGVSSLEALQD